MSVSTTWSCVKKTCLACLVMLWVFSFVTKSNAQDFSTFEKNNEVFSYEVKVIDEFIERFNDDPRSFIRGAFKEQNRPFTLTRKELIASLFNLSNNAIVGDSTLNGFFRTVTNKKSPVVLSFTDTSWYAEATTEISYNEKKMEVPLLLHIHKNGKHGAKWMIAGVGDMVPADANHSVVNYKDFKAETPPTFISTSSYASDFVTLHYIFVANMEPSNFFEPSVALSSKGNQFIQLILENKLHFLYVRDLKFHFFQVNDWIFTVAQFKRQTYNSGWLIDSIQKVTPEEKKQLRNKLLFL